MYKSLKSTLVGFVSFSFVNNSDRSLLTDYKTAAVVLVTMLESQLIDMSSVTITATFLPVTYGVVVVPAIKKLVEAS